MYSKKQLWMHQKKRVHRLGSNELYETYLEFTTVDPTRRTLSDSAISPSTPSQHPLESSKKHSISATDTSELSSTNNTSSNMSSGSSSKPSRHVKFGNQVNVVLIPTRHEYKDADIDSIMWWKSNELRSFKSSAEDEVRAVMCDMMTDSLHARTVLYQPLASIVAC